MDNYYSMLLIITLLVAGSTGESIFKSNKMFIRYN